MRRANQREREAEGLSPAFGPRQRKRMGVSKGKLEESKLGRVRDRATVARLCAGWRAVRWRAGTWSWAGRCGRPRVGRAGPGAIVATACTCARTARLLRCRRWTGAGAASATTAGARIGTPASLMAGVRRCPSFGLARADAPRAGPRRPPGGSAPRPGSGGAGCGGRREDRGVTRRQGDASYTVTCEMRSQRVEPC